MGVYALVMSLRVHDIAFLRRFGALVLWRGWRVAWAAVGVALIFGLAPVAWLFVRREPQMNDELDVVAVESTWERPRWTPHSRSALRLAGVFGCSALASSLYGAGRVWHRPVQRVDSRGTWRVG